MESSLFNIFVYGTLKRGQRNHAPYCDGALDVREAEVCGWLYDLPFGFPALVVPEETILAVGTGDYAGDAGKQRSEVRMILPSKSVAHGELPTFDDPKAQLPALDGLEGFRPGEPGLYQRVLIPVHADGESLLAWAYTVERPAGNYLPGGEWPL